MYQFAHTLDAGESEYGMARHKEPGYWQKRYMAEHDRFLTERDRRHTEGNALREQALAIKQAEEEKALDLSRKAQEYRDEQANKLREQINSERNLYVTKEALEAALAPLTETASQSRGSTLTKATLLTYAIVVVMVLSLVVAFANGRIG